MVNLPIRRSDKTKLTDVSKVRAPRHEREMANTLGARQTRGSGNQTEKGDARIKGVARIEAKCTRNKSFSVTRDMWGKIEDAGASCAEGEIPVLHIEFLTPEGQREKGLYVLREEDVEELIAEATNATPDERNARTRGKISNPRRGSGSG
jgi:hypothetical protein